MVLSRKGGLRIATFNINNINKRLQNLTAWLATAKPDVVCLQELKAEQHPFPSIALVISVIAESGSASALGTASQSWRVVATRW
jgi:exodeoxyribonuclease-3